MARIGITKSGSHQPTLADQSCRPSRSFCFACTFKISLSLCIFFWVNCPNVFLCPKICISQMQFFFAPVFLFFPWSLLTVLCLTFTKKMFHLVRAPLVNQREDCSCRLTWKRY
jgi:hypothetical protein